MTDDEKFKGKYRIASTRWVDWDYSSNASYFVTISVANRAHVFGEIVKDEIKLSPLGQSAQDCWDEIPTHFPFVELGGFVVMPNHVHGVVIINKNGNVETQNFASLPPQPDVPKNRFGPQSQNLASIIRGYKIGVTKFAPEKQYPV